MKNAPFFVGLGLMVLILGWIFAPSAIVHFVLFDILWLGLPYLLPALVIVLLVLLAAMRSEGLTIAVFVVGVIALIGWWIYLPALSRYELVDSIKPVHIEDIPASSNVRFMPMPVAQQLASSKYQDPRHHIGDMDPIELESGDIGWVGSRIPTGAVNYYTGNAQGTITVDPFGRVTTQDQVFACGEGMAITDNIRWKLWREHYGAVLDEYYYITIDDEIVLMAPYITWHFEGIVFVPQWGGVFVVDGNCHIEDLSPREALADSRLIGHRIVPENYAKRVADAWQYRNGIANAWFHHVDQTEVPTIDGEDNQMPYLIPTELGEQWFIAMEPYGPAFSIFKMMFVDAHDGTIRLYEYSEDAAIISPNKALGFIQAANPTYNWDKIRVIEPRPLIVENVLYWMMSQTSSDFSGVERTILVRSSDEKVLVVESYEELVVFLSGNTATASQLEEGSVTAGGEIPSDLSTLTTQELYDLIMDIARELESR